MLKLQKLSFSYLPDQPVLTDLSLTLEKGELLSVMGPSGCGKSTLLNLIAGLLSPTNGSLELGFEKIAYVFQEPRLFPWLTVRQNLSAVLPHRHDPQIIESALKTVGLQQDGGRYPHELSGGMKSRVSLARALVYGGDLMLLDEPFSALDEALRKELLCKLRTTLKNSNMAAVLVTHQSEDAAAFADRQLLLPSHLTKA